MARQVTDLTLDELQTRKSKLQGAVFGLGFVMLVAVGVVLYVAATKKIYGLLAVAFTLPLTLLPSVIALAKINEEIKTRQPA